MKSGIGSNAGFSLMENLIALVVLSVGLLTITTNPARIYLVDLSNTSATTFTIDAAPDLVQAAQDTICGTLSLTHTGQRSQTGAGTRCW